MKIIVCGPTASGKTFLAHELAKKFQSQVINIDALQVYQGIEIISASPDQNYKNEVKYVLYNFLDLEEKYSVGRYLRDLQQKSIYNNDIFVGGSGLYIKALLNGIAEIPDVPREEEIFEKIGQEEFKKALLKLDPSCSNLHDKSRLIRAYSVIIHTGMSINFFKNNLQKVIQDNFKVIFLNPERSFLYSNCNLRVLDMIKNGVLDEVGKIKNSHHAIGVKDFRQFLNNEISLEDTISKVQKLTRNYAKRQFTWFRNQVKPDIVLNYSSTKDFYIQVQSILENITTLT